MKIFKSKDNYFFQEQLQSRKDGILTDSELESLWPDLFRDEGDNLYQDLPTKILRASAYKTQIFFSISTGEFISGKDYSNSSSVSRDIIFLGEIVAEDVETEILRYSPAWDSYHLLKSCHTKVKNSLSEKFSELISNKMWEISADKRVSDVYGRLLLPLETLDKSQIIELILKEMDGGFSSLENSRNLGSKGKVLQTLNFGERENIIYLVEISNFFKLSSCDFESIVRGMVTVIATKKRLTKEDFRRHLLWKWPERLEYQKWNSQPLTVDLFWKCLHESLSSVPDW